MKQAVTSSAWTQLKVTTTDTWFSAEEGDVRITGESTSGRELTDGGLLREGQGVVISGGRTVSAVAVKSSGARVQVEEVGAVA